MRISWLHKGFLELVLENFTNMEEIHYKFYLKHQLLTLITSLLHECINLIHEPDICSRFLSSPSKFISFFTLSTLYNRVNQFNQSLTFFYQFTGITDIALPSFPISFESHSISQFLVLLPFILARTACKRAFNGIISWQYQTLR